MSIRQLPIAHEPCRLSTIDCLYSVIVRARDLEINQWPHWCIDVWLAVVVVILVVMVVLLGGSGHPWLITRTSAPGGLDITNRYQRVSFVFWPASVMAATASSVVVLDRGNNTTCTINLHGNCDIVHLLFIRKNIILL